MAIIDQIKVKGDVMRRIFYAFVVIFALFLTGCADAGKDQVVHSGDLVTLDGSASEAVESAFIRVYV